MPHCRRPVQRSRATFIAGLVNLILVALAPTSGAGTLKTVTSFTESNGAFPESGLTAVGSTLYGTTSAGGTSDDGTLFSYDPSSGRLKTLVHFNKANGARPESGLIDVNGTLYGTTFGDSFPPVSNGTLFSYDPSSGHLKTLVRFNGSNGKYPEASLTAVGSTLYGTTSGASKNHGTLFSYDPSSGRLKTLAHFTGSNGKYPEASLTAVGNTLYGTTLRGGSELGTLFAYQLPTSSTSWLGSLW